ncbi:MAG: YncE family protein [Acidimicrobiales bacterium]
MVLVVAAAIELALTVTPVTTVASAKPAVPMAYVTNSQLNSLSIYAGVQFAGRVPNVGSGPTGIAVDSRGSTAYVADFGFFDQPSYTVTPIDLVSGKALRPIRVGTGPLAIAIRPGDQFAVVTLQGTPSKPGHQIREINLATRAISRPVDVGTNPQSLAIAPDGKTAYVADFSSAEVTPVDLTSWPPRALPPIPLPGTSPNGIAISPDGRTAYVLDAVSATVIPISLPSATIGQPLDLVCHMQGDPGCTPHAIVISRDGRTAYVAAAGSGDVMLLNLPSLTVAGVVQVGAYPDALGLSGRWLYVANGASDTMSIFPGLQSPWTVGGVTYPYGVAVVSAAKASPDTVPPISSPLAASEVHGASQVDVDSRPSPFYGAGAS